MGDIRGTRKLDRERKMERNPGRRRQRPHSHQETRTQEMEKQAKSEIARDGRQSRQKTQEDRNSEAKSKTPAREVPSTDMKGRPGRRVAGGIKNKRKKK